MLAHIHEGSDARAINQILAAGKIADKPDEGAALNALESTFDQLKIIDTDPAVGQIALSTDGQQILSIGNDGTMAIRAADTGAVTATFPKSLVFSADGSRVLLFTDDDRLQVRDTKSGQPIGPAVEPSKDGGGVHSATFSPDLRKIVFAQAPSSLYLWDIESGKTSLMGNFPERLSDVAVTPDGGRVVSSGFDGNIRVWDAETGRQLSQPISLDSGSAIAVLKDGHRVVTEGESVTGIRIWDLESGQLIAHGEEHAPAFGNYVRSIAASPDGRRIISGSTDHTIQIWDAETASPIGGP